MVNHHCNFGDVGVGNDGGNDYDVGDGGDDHHTLCCRPNLTSWRREMLIWRKSLRWSPSKFPPVFLLS